MSKQTLKTLTMLTLVVGLTLATAVITANGQLTFRHVVADIPFDFIVGDKTLPSGKYTVSTTISNGDAVRISSRDGKSSAIRLSNLLDEKSKRGRARMVFHRYGQRYFLAEIWSNDNYGHKLMQSRLERNLRRELVSNQSKSDSANGTYETVEVLVLVR